MIRTAVLGEIFFLFFTLSIAASQENYVPEAARAYPPTLLKKQPLPTKLRLTALGGRAVPVTKRDRENFVEFTGSYCTAPEKTALCVKDFMLLDKRAKATFLGLVPFFKFPHEFLTKFLTVWAEEDIPKTDNKKVSALFFDPFYRKLFSPVKRCFISCERQPPWSKNLKIIGIGGQSSKLVFGAENSNTHTLTFLNATGDYICENNITKNPFEKELQQKLCPGMSKIVTSEESKIIIDKQGTNALIEQQKRLEIFDQMLINNLYSWKTSDRDELKEDDITTEDEADIITNNSLLLTNFENKSHACLETERFFPAIKRPGSFSFRQPTNTNWRYALSDNGTLALYKNNSFIQLYKRTDKIDLLDTKKDREIEKMVFNADGSLLAVCGADLHIWQQKKHENCMTWKEIFTQTIPNISDIEFDPEGCACLVASRTGGVYYISLTTEKPKILRLKLSNVGISRAIFGPNGNVFATIGLDRTIKIYHIDNKKKLPLLLCKFSQKQNNIYCGNEAFVDAKFSPYEENTIMFATEGGWIVSWHYLTGKIENFLAYDGLSTAPRIREFFILGPRHVLLWLEDGTIKELFALSPAAFFVYKTLSKNKNFSLMVPNKSKNFKKAPSLFNTREKMNQEFYHVGLPFRIKYKKPKNIESSFELSF